jgi:hypothetical protein
MNDRCAGIGLLVVSGVIWWVTRDYPFGSKVLPLALATLIGFLALPMVFKKQPDGAPLPLKKLLPYTLVVLGAIVLMDLVGFFVSLVFLVAGGMIVQQQRSVLKIILNSAIFCLLCYLFFLKFLALPLPRVWG